MRSQEYGVTLSGDGGGCEGGKGGGGLALPAISPLYSAVPTVGGESASEAQRGKARASTLRLLHNLTVSAP